MLFTILFAAVLSKKAHHHFMETKSPLPEVMDFEEWKRVFKSEGYFSQDEHDQKHKTYEANLAYITTRNAEGNSFRLGVNQFADLTQKEFAAQYLVPMNRTRQKNYQHLEPLHPEADGVDWRTQGAVTKVKNQGNCGSCWSFSTTGAVEGCVAVASGNLTSLSEQELVNCNTQTDHGCNGGLMDYAFEWIASNGGLNSEENWGYTATQGTCDQSKLSYKVSVTKNHVDVQQDSDSQMAAALQRGPVSIAIEADQQAFQFYKSGIFKDPCGTNLDHGVLAVGYAADYFIVKNSWGETWGLNGYIQLARGVAQQGGQCGILMAASFPTECSSLSPGPPTPPGPSPTPGSEHYADPANGCITGETQLSLPSVAGSTCSATCNSGTCPAAPSHMLGFSSCGVYDKATDDLRCAVFCSPSVPTDCDPANKMTCKPYQNGSGICTYDD